jgi:hypothetical protein
MLASQSGLAFEEHSVVLVMSGMGRLISGEAQSGTGGALLTAKCVRRWGSVLAGAWAAPPTMGTVSGMALSEYRG